LEVNETSTAFSKIGTDRYLQDHWLRRLIAIIIDSILIAIVVWIAVLIASVLGFPLPVLGIPMFTAQDLIQGVLHFLYAAVIESTWGATIGKQIMNLKTTRLDGGRATLDRTLLRDLSRIHGLFWLIDVVVGMATVGDPHQKILDRYAGTTVVSTIDRTMILPGPPSPPTPPSPP
jgi:uncharacterized RDD family membrane protein YckC